MKTRRFEAFPGRKRPRTPFKAIGNGAVGVVAGLPAAGAEMESTCLDTSKLPQPIDRRGFLAVFMTFE